MIEAQLKTTFIGDSFFHSQLEEITLCSGCGVKDTELTLSDRIYNCKNCHLVIDRDLNASINIRIAGIARLA